MQLIAPAITPSLDPDFRPAALAWRAFAALIADNPHPVRIAIEQGDGSIYVFERNISSHDIAVNLRFLERELKFLLWAVGGFRIHIDAPENLVALLRNYIYRYDANRLFDMEVMGPTIYGRPCEIVAQSTTRTREFCAAYSAINELLESRHGRGTAVLTTII